MKAALVISARDNVATALEPLEAGRRLDIEGAEVTVLEPIEPGHKVALLAIAAGADVVKYGSPIGQASADIPPGAHVHTHNLASGRGRGDLGVPTAPSQPRVAEPPDDPPPVLAASVPAEPPDSQQDRPPA